MRETHDQSKCSYTRNSACLRRLRSSPGARSCQYLARRISQLSLELIRKVGNVVKCCQTKMSEATNAQTMAVGYPPRLPYP